MRTVGKDVAIKLLPVHNIAPMKTASGLLVAGVKLNLIPVEVVADYEPLKLSIGDKVFVDVTEANQPWAKRHLRVEGMPEFVLMPAEKVLLVESKPVYVDRPRPRPLPTSIPSCGRRLDGTVVYATDLDPNDEGRGI